MATNPPGPALPNKARMAILAELEKERRRLLNAPGASISMSRPSLKEFRDNAEQQHIAAQQKAALQDSSFGNLILPVIPRLEPES
ncbi:SOSS complex subunit C isoform X2 [Anarhichas minor]|uniref:SOSS complex subunit C isoform X2 n=1 Tax=Anarhichas minor TaxID=65739 RepID=UPI003F73B417